MSEELQRLALGETVADVQCAVVGNADDIAGKGLIDRFALLREEKDRRRHIHRFAFAHIEQLHAASEFARTQPHEGDAIAMVRVHIGLDLKYKAAGSSLIRRDHTRRRLARKRSGRPACQAGKEFSDAEILQRAAEDHRREMALTERLGVEPWQIAQAQFQAFQRWLGDTVFDSRVWIKRLNAFELCQPSYESE